MAEGMLEAIRMITGVTDQLEAVGLKEEDSPEELMDRIQESVNRVNTGDGVILFADLFGATPFNASARLAMMHGEGFEVICGMNLPMMLELVMQREGETFLSLIEIAIENGKNGVLHFDKPPLINT
jgi:mannose/fructose/sorbose-specific phosphotransferase system IIA component